MANLRIQQKIAALNKKKCEEHPQSNMAQNTNVPTSKEDYITQFSEEIEGRVMKKLSKEFSRTESRILGALSHLNKFLLNPLIQGHSGCAQEASRNTPGTNRGTNEDDSQSDPHPEASVSQSQTARNFGLRQWCLRPEVPTTASSYCFNECLYLCMSVPSLTSRVF